MVQHQQVQQQVRAGLWLRAMIGMLASVTVASALSAAETPEVLVELDQARIFVGESVQYRVLLNHCGMRAEPDMSAFKDFDIKLVSRQEVENSQYYNNGRESRRVLRIGPLFEYQLTPREVGEIKVPGPSVEIGGKTYAGQSLTLTVADIEDQDLVQIEVTTAPSSVYPMQPFQVRLTLFVKGLPDPAADTDPLQLRRPLPALTIPWASDEKLDEKLLPKEPFNRWLQQYVDRSSHGVSINELQESRADVFEIFGARQRDRRLAFRSPPERVIREDGTGRQVEYWKYTFERTLIAQRAGEVALGNVTLKGQFAARINTRGNVELDSVYTVASSPRVVIKQPPLAGRPATFTGAIGSFVGGAELTPLQASVGDPLTLTLWIRGTGTLSETTAPDLASMPEIAEHFKVYDATEETDQDTRRFTYSLRPKTADVSNFPAVPLAYFDVDREEYVTLKTDPIPITIAASNQLASSEIAIATGAASPSSEIGTLTDGIFANVTDLSQLRHDQVHPNRWFLSMGGLACLFVVMTFVVQRLQQVREDTGLQRRRSALGRARRRIDAVAGGTTRELVDGISSALVGLVADLADLPEEGLTSADAAAGLTTRDIDPELVQQFQALLETCDASRYASLGTEFASLQQQALTLLTELGRELRTRKLIS